MTNDRGQRTTPTEVDHERAESPHQKATGDQGAVLIVDDEEEHARTLVRLLAREGLDARAVHHVTDALDALRNEQFDVVVTDLVMPGKSGLDLLRSVQHLELDCGVVLMTAYGTVERAVDAMKAGAVDFLVKPIKRAPFLQTVRRALEQTALRRENESLKREIARLRDDRLALGDAEGFRRALSVALQAATSDATILLTGESGSGKEVFAQEIHRASTRADGPFVALHCAALPTSVIEAELFGHGRGAFTGAERARVGRIEAANGGTLLLDEVGEIPPAIQVKLLRVLESGEVVRVGENEPRRVDVRIVAATHRDLEAAAREGSFREDLYYRLAVITIRVPPLRERTSDIPLLAAHFAGRVAAANDRSPPRITQEANEVLVAHDWPGNVRELRNVIERAVVLDDDDVISPRDLPGLSSTSSRDPVVEIRVGTPLADAERELILATLEHTGGDKQLAASVLGVGRRTIYRKLDEYRQSDD